MPDTAPQEVVLSEVSDGVMTITLNRPERSNAWNGAMSRGYFGLLDAAARSAEVRAIVVTGSAKAFSTGGDSEVIGGIAEGGAIPGSGKASPARTWPHWFAMQVGKPVIAAVNGACFGIGMLQALCCDVRFAADDAKFSTAYAKRGLVAEMGMSWLLPRLVGTGHAMDLMLSARLVRAPEAERMGLVNRIVPAADLVAEAQAYARQMAGACSPRAMRMIKEQAWRDLMIGMPEAYGRAEARLDEAFRSDDFREGVRSWTEGRAPAFAPLAGELAFIDYEG